MEDINWTEGSVRVIWEILPGESSRIFREIDLEDIDPTLYTPIPQTSREDFPIFPHPLLNPEDDCLDRVWDQSIIKINYLSGE